MSRKRGMLAALYGAAMALNPRNIWGGGKSSNEPAPQQGIPVEEMDAMARARREEREQLEQRREAEHIEKTFKKLAKQGLTPEDISEGRHTGKRLNLPQDQRPRRKKRKKRLKWKQRKWGSCRTSQNRSK